jgi:hypothetical protein
MVSLKIQKDFLKFAEIAEIAVIVENADINTPPWGRRAD